ncbi:hypothetical protein TRAPUB_9147 [Trametes pubescens]|uniref:Uncharacterized protein n=1 Tax=Trametes pubescens TaxID=154538 RepID=A0A1M2W346_TRAPU|nr:hypothetical protein TRAPUB_9147 [Trametes pubescens]
MTWQILSSLNTEQQVRNIWRIQFSSSALLFYVVRYAALFSSILIVLNGTVWSGQNNLYTFTQSSTSIGVVPLQSCSSVSTISDAHYVK